MLDESRVKAAIEDASFQKIYEIHEKMKESGRKDAVPLLLLEMVDRYVMTYLIVLLAGHGHKLTHRYVMEFLVAYAYLENSIPEGYYGHNFTYLGCASKLPSLLVSLGVVYNPLKA